MWGSEAKLQRHGGARRKEQGQGVGTSKTPQAIALSNKEYRRYMLSLQEAAGGGQGTAVQPAQGLPSSPPEPVPSRSQPRRDAKRKAPVSSPSEDIYLCRIYLLHFGGSMLACYLEHAMHSAMPATMHNAAALC